MSNKVETGFYALVRKVADKTEYLYEINGQHLWCSKFDSAVALFTWKQACDHPLRRSGKVDPAQVFVDLGYADSARRR